MLGAAKEFIRTERTLRYNRREIRSLQLSNNFYEYLYHKWLDENTFNQINEIIKAVDA